MMRIGLQCFFENSTCLIVLFTLTNPNRFGGLILDIFIGGSKSCNGHTSILEKSLRIIEFLAVK